MSHSDRQGAEAVHRPATAELGHRLYRPCGLACFPAIAALPDQGHVPAGLLESARMCRERARWLGRHPDTGQHPARPSHGTPSPVVVASSHQGPPAPSAGVLDHPADGRLPWCRTCQERSSRLCRRQDTGQGPPQHVLGPFSGAPAQRIFDFRRDRRGSFNLGSCSPQGRGPDRAASQFFKLEIMSIRLLGLAPSPHRSVSVSANAHAVRPVPPRGLAYALGLE